MARKNVRIMQAENKTHNVIEKEAELSDRNSKTVVEKKFKGNLKQTNKLNASLKYFQLLEL